MAKKQTIILSHGSSMPVLGNFSALGEVLVQHGSGATETMLHTLNAESGVTSFPSTEWVESKISGADSDLRNEIASARTEFQEAISENVESLQGEIASAKSELNDALTASTKTLQDQIDAHDERLNEQAEAIANALTAATAYTDTQVQSLKDVEIKNLNDLISEVSATTEEHKETIATLATKKELEDAVASLTEDMGEMSADFAASASTLQSNIDKKVAQSAYDTKVKALEDAAKTE